MSSPKPPQRKPSLATATQYRIEAANLSGHDSHGVGMVPRYVDAVQEGGLRPNTGAKATMDIGTLLARGESRDVMDSFRELVGREPRIEPLVERRGLA